MDTCPRNPEFLFGYGGFRHFDRSKLAIPPHPHALWDPPTRDLLALPASTTVACHTWPCLPDHAAPHLPLLALPCLPHHPHLALRRLSMPALPERAKGCRALRYHAPPRLPHHPCRC